MNKNSQIIPFQYENASIRIIKDENGDPWWVAKDVCDVLNLQNPSMAIDPLDEDERAKKNLGRQGETWFINESGLYALIIRSNKPDAKKFRKWITSEVLPSIRKTGAYHADNARYPIEEIKAVSKRVHETSQIIADYMRVSRESGTPTHVARINAIELAYQITGIDCSMFLPAPHSEKPAYDLLSDILVASIRMEDGEERTVFAVITDAELLPHHVAAMHRYGLKLNGAGDLFVVPHLLQEKLLARTKWKNIPIRGHLLQIPNATAKQSKLAGERAWGCVIPMDYIREVTG